MSAGHPRRTIGPAVSCGVILLAAVAATGCESSSSTSVTNPTAVRCTVGVSPASAAIGPGGGSASVAVTVNRECAWSARAEADWVALSSPASGQGNGTVSFSVAPNTSTSSRRTALLINDARVEVSQTGIACAYSLGSEGRSFDANGGEFTVSVSTQATCEWRATSNAPWLALTAARSGTGNGIVSVAVAENTGVAREGTLTVAGRTFTVRQAAPGGPVPPEPPPATACTFVVAPPAPSVPAAGGMVRVTVAASGASCVWTATSGVSWITITSGASGTDDGEVTLSVAPNTGAARSGLVTVAGQAVRVNQLAAAQTPTCSFTVSPTTIPEVSADGGSGRVDVAASDASCPWTASSSASWLRVTSGSSGTGDGTVAYTVNPNTGASDRSATLTVAGRVLTVTQAGAPAPVVCTVSVSPTAASVPAGGGTGSVSVTVSDASCRWSAASDVSWLTISTGSSGTGNGSVGYSVAENTETVERSGTIDVSGRIVTVTQDPASPPPVNEVSLRGDITGLAGVCPFTTFTVEARLVTTNPATVYERGDCDKLRNGRSIRVTGNEQLNGTVLATRVRFD